MTDKLMNTLEQIARKKQVAKTCEKAEQIKTLLRNGTIKHQPDGCLTITPEGRQALRRWKLAKDEEQIFASQHQARVSAPASEKLGNPEGNVAQPARTPRRNLAESPLALLAMRKRTDGSPYLEPHQVDAGERLRGDFERGRLSPSLGIDWARLGETSGAVSKKARSRQDRADLSASALDAQQRFRHAVDFVGEELSGALVDFCCFLKGLEEIEKSRHWPARSAKQIIALALSRLARHYGFDEMAVGPVHQRIRQWGTTDYRPQPK